METKDILELISFDTLVAMLLFIDLKGSMQILEFILVISAITYNIVRIVDSRKKKK